MELVQLFIASMSVSRTEWSRVLLRVPFERSAQAILGGADLHIRSQIPDGKSSSLRLRQSLLVKQKQRLKIDQIVTSVCVRGPIRSCRIFAGVVTGVLPVSTGTVGGRLVAPQTRPVQSRSPGLLHVSDGDTGNGFPVYSSLFVGLGLSRGSVFEWPYRVGFFFQFQRQCRGRRGLEHRGLLVRLKSSKDDDQLRRHVSRRLDLDLFFVLGLGTNYYKVFGFISQGTHDTIWTNTSGVE